MRVLITGVGGFIGTALARRLQMEGHEIVGLVRAGENGAGAPAGVLARTGDMTDAASLRAAVEGCEAVVHLAAATGVPDDALARAVNVDGTHALIEAMRAAGAKRLVFISTVSALREHLGSYGRTKKEGEALTRASGLDWTILRPSLVYGPGGKGLFASLSAHIRTLPVVPVIGSGRYALEPVHLDDVCAVIASSLVNSATVGQAYDLVGPETMSFNDFLAALQRQMGARKPAVHIPVWFALLMARALQVVSKRPPLTVDNVLGATQETPSDRGPLARDFPLPWIRLEQGMRTLD